MTKKIITFVTLIAVAITALFCMTGCAGDQYTPISISGTQKTTYTVTSNGGSAVQYGNYIYFLNGYRGYEDTNASANVFGQVVKGAVYRAELNGSEIEGEFVASRDASTGLLLKTTKKIDYKRDEIDSALVQRIAPKTVGTSGYSQGGITILGNCMYYATPNNLKNKSGSVQYLKTDFFRMTLDGQTTQKLYTTENDSTSSPYAFFKRGSYVYLVVLDGTNLISVKSEFATGKVVDTLKIAENVTSAVIPTKPVYYNGITENSIYDFIYFVRSATSSDITQTGEILEFIRPDGSSRQVFEADGVSDYTLEYVRDGYLFYRKPKNGNVQLFASNLHEQLSVADSAYANDAYNANLVNEEKSVFNDSDIANLGTYAFVAGYEFGTTARSNSVNVLSYTKASEGSDSSSTAVTVKRYVDGVYDDNFSLSATGLAIQTQYDNKVYYSADGKLYSISIAPGSVGTINEISDSFVAGTYGADVAGEHLIYFAGSGDATQYAYFSDLNKLEGKEDMFVGEYLASEVPSEVESIVVETTPTKTNYDLGEKLNLSGLVVKATLYRDSEGQRPESFEVAITEDMISGYDPNTSGDQSITITYKKRTATFDIHVSENRVSTSCATVAPTTPWFFIGGGMILIVALGALMLFKNKKEN